MSARVGRALLALPWLVACGGETVRHLDPVSVALTDDVGPVYDDGELVIYEAKTELPLPITAPGGGQMQQLWDAGPVDPFERPPWVDAEDLEVQVHYTITNLDEESHQVWLMIDPWNEFARYEPAIVVNDDEAARDFSGVDLLFLVPGVGELGVVGADGDGRITGTLSYDDMRELALDLATIFKIVTDVVVGADGEDDPRSTLVNHALNVRNREYNSPLLEPYSPAVVPALTGFDFGVRTGEPANVAVELSVELRDLTGDRVPARGENSEQLQPPDAVISSTSAL